MKLFTKEINNKLFKQFPLGNDLEKQVVVAKIFNPYGRGKWYLINSDPSDPDYIWAIVDNYEVEIGSVSRRDLENLRITAFGWPLERDIYFSPMNAAEVFRGLRSGKRYATGGNVSMDESVQMVSSQAKEAKHHANELSQAIKGQTHIEPWVVAKMERATTDLSDVTHYLDGKTEYAKGGEVKERVYIEYLNKKKNYQRDIKHFDSYEDAKQWALKNFDKFNPDMIKYEYAEGGGVDRYVLSFNYNPSIVKSDYLEKLVENYTKDWKHDNDWDEVTFYVQGLTKEKAKELESELKMEDVYNIEVELGRYKFAKGGGVGKSSDKYTVYLYYGRGQEPSVHKNVSLRTAEMLVMTAEHAEIVDSKGNVVDLSQYAEGGMAKARLQANPTYKHQNSVKRWIEDAGDSLKYKVAVKLLEGDSNPDESLNIGQSQYARILRSIEKIGGESSHEMQWRKENYSLAEAEGWALDSLKKCCVLKYAEGGMATFDDKVKAISERLEGTKVKGKYRKEYGATYDKKESKQAATKIAGKMRARERAKEILNKRKKK